MMRVDNVLVGASAVSCLLLHPLASRGGSVWDLALASPLPHSFCLQLGSLPLSELHSFPTGVGGTLMWTK